MARNSAIESAEATDDTEFRGSGDLTRGAADGVDDRADVVGGGDRGRAGGGD